MSATEIQVFVATFDNESRAKEALNDIHALERAGSIELIDAAVVVRDAEGKVRVQEQGESGGRKWAKRGAIAGGLVGLIFPPSIVVSAIAGGGAAGIWGKIRDKGFSGRDLEKLGQGIEPGKSAIIAIAEKQVVERLHEVVSTDGQVARQPVSAEAAAAIAAARPS